MWNRNVFLAILALTCLGFLLLVLPEPSNKEFLTVMKKYDGVDKTKRPDTPASRKWLEVAMDIVKFHRDSDPPRVARLYAYVASVFADVFEKTNDEQEAGLAAAKLLVAFYPEENARITSQFPTKTNLESPLSAQGEAVFERYLTRSTTDGFDLEWDQAVPAGDNLWYRRIHVVDSPRAGEWEPWIMEKHTPITIPPPPAKATLQDRYEMVRVALATEARTQEDLDNIFIWNGGPAFRKLDNTGNVTPAGVWQNVLYTELAATLTPAQYTRVQKILAQSIADSFIACWKIKFVYWLPRPSQRIPDLKLAVADPEFPAYPSGHSCSGQTAATVLSHLFPDQERVWQQVSASTRHARLVGGVHWEIDTLTGADLGEQVGIAIINALDPAKVPKHRLAAYRRPSRLTLFSLLLRFNLKRTTRGMLARLPKPSPQQEEERLKRLYRTSGSPRELRALIDMYRNQRRFDEAEVLLKEAIQKQPANLELYFLLGNYYRQVPEHYAEAERILANAVTINPQDQQTSLLYIQLGKLYEVQKRDREAEAAFRKALAVSPYAYALDGVSSAYQPLATLLGNQRHYKEAYALLLPLISADPSPEVYIELAHLLMLHDQRAQAEETLKEGIGVFPKNNALRNALTTLYEVKDTTTSPPGSVQ